jgi:predicted RNA binding protein YcfA (HicA-like mRNA interferase family)
LFAEASFAGRISRLHHVLEHSSVPRLRVVVSAQGNPNMLTGTSRSVLKQADLTPEALLE